MAEVIDHSQASRFAKLFEDPDRLSWSRHGTAPVGLDGSDHPVLVSQFQPGTEPIDEHVLAFFPVATTQHSLDLRWMLRGQVPRQLHACCQPVEVGLTLGSIRRGIHTLHQRGQLQATTRYLLPDRLTSRGWHIAWFCIPATIDSQFDRVITGVGD